MDFQTLGIAIVAVVIFWADRMGWLPSKQSPADAAGELSIAEKTIARLRHERNLEHERAEKLSQERTNEPVILLLHEISAQLAETAKAQVENARAQAQVIDRLAKHNGSFAHMETGLGEVIESMRTLTGLIAELHDLPLKGRS